MTSKIRRTTLRLLAAVALTAPIVLAQSGPTEADAGPFDTLLGSWRGSGQMELSQGKTERLKCNAYYTGGGSQLGMAIRCQSESSNVEIRSKLSQSGGRITAPGRSAPSMPKETPLARLLMARSLSLLAGQ